MYEKYDKLIFYDSNSSLSISMEFIGGGFNYDNITLY